MGRRNGVKISPTRRALIFGNLPRFCYYCPAPFTKDDPATMDHIIPVSRGGANHPQNIALCHRSCNMDKAYLTAVEYFAKIGYDGPVRRGLRKDQPEMNSVYNLTCYFCKGDFLSKTTYNRYCDKYCRVAANNVAKPAQAPIFAALAIKHNLYL